MTPELQRRWQASHPPFDGSTVVTCDDPTTDDVLEMLQVIGAQLTNRYPTLLGFDDWHEHDGFLTEPTPATWETTIANWSDIQTLHKSCHDDDYVRIALFSPTFDWLLRFDLHSSDSSAIEDAWPYLDFTASRNTIAADVIASITQRWPGYTCISPAAAHFQSCYAG